MIKKFIRCDWAGDNPLYCEYHDTEWGVPCHDDGKLFELLVLEGFQAGLSWITILRKRENFRRAFHNWDWNRIARYGKADIERLMRDRGIVRNRRKIEAAVKNARAFIKVREEFGTFDAYMWRFTSGKTLRRRKRKKRFKDLPTHSAESDAMSRDLKKRGFAFVGKVVCYAHMQAVGMVDDHLEGCWKAGERRRDIICESPGNRPADRDFGGCIVPMLTPFNAGGAVAEEMFERHLDFLLSAGVRRILVNGTTGEFFSLTREERHRIFTAARKRFEGVIVFHAGCAGIGETVDEARWGEGHGADAVIVSAPFYLADAPLKGVINYFREVAETVSIPFILYNFPKHTQNAVTGEVLSAVKHFGLKDSSGDLSLISNTPHYYTGPDTLIVEAMRKGAFGFVSAHANVAPCMLAYLERMLIEEGGEADEVQEKISRMTAVFSGSHHIAKLKYALSLVLDGYPARVRPPLVNLDKKDESSIDRFINDINAQ